MGRKGRPPKAKVKDTSHTVVDYGEAEVEPVTFDHLSEVVVSRDPMTGIESGGEVDEETPEVKVEETPETEPTPETKEPTVDWQKRYEHLNTKFAEQGTELGQYRKHFDEQVKVKPMTDEEFNNVYYESPRTAIGSELGVVKNQLKDEILSELRLNTALDVLNQHHPDMQDIVNSEDFQEWSSKSVPSSLVLKGDENPEIADYVLSQYKQFKNTNSSEAAVAEKIATKRVMANSIAGVGQSTAPTNEKPVFKRIEIMEMIANNPRKYESMQTEIQRAYAEGRVK